MYSSGTCAVQEQVQHHTDAASTAESDSTTRCMQLMPSSAALAVQRLCSIAGCASSGGAILHLL
jgi:hypothetical protein